MRNQPPRPLPRPPACPIHCAIVGEKGFIEDEPLATDWRGLLVGGAAAVIRPALGSIGNYEA
jgi:hypothetical protein